jgi:hypothetical protein
MIERFKGYITGLTFVLDFLAGLCKNIQVPARIFFGRIKQ